jgi:hypothetical protein
MKDLIRDLQDVLRKHHGDLFVNDEGDIRIDKYKDIEDDEPQEHAFLNQPYLNGDPLTKLEVQKNEYA